MKATFVSIAAVLFVLAAGTPASAQLAAATDGPIVYGHHHLNVTNVDAHKKFWVEGLGGTIIKVGTSPAEIVRFHNVLVMMTARAPSGGTKGTSVNHIGFQVPNVRSAVDKVKAAGYPIVTRAELPSTVPVKDDLGFIADQNTYIAYTMGPDDTKVELVENKALKVPISMHHIHFAAPKVDEMKAWYVKTFNAKGGKRGSFEAADLPGVNLTFSPSAEPVVPTRGRALDHIGFEVKGLENFVKQLEAQGIKIDRPYTKVAALNLAIAFITDPWGTYIELTEGFDAVP
jgi:catechol 2,3-dioxygenase-like lactoylglutathione lyase family enzyme